MMKNSTTKKSQMKASKLFTTSIITILILFLTCLPMIESEASVLDSVGVAALIAGQGTSVIIPDSVTSIDDNACTSAEGFI